MDIQLLSEYLVSRGGHLNHRFKPWEYPEVFCHLGFPAETVEECKLSLASSPDPEFSSNAALHTVTMKNVFEGSTGLYFCLKLVN